MFVVPLQLRNVCGKFLFARHAAEVKTNHLIRAQRWLAPSPQTDHHASNDRAIGLNLDAPLVVAQQVPTPEDVFEKTEEYFYLPSVVK